jgi:hypothetical protein
VKIDVDKVRALIAVVPRATGTLRADADLMRVAGQVELATQTRAIANELFDAMVALQDHLFDVRLANLKERNARRDRAFNRKYRIGRKS